jgi:hypothetical protein
MKTFTINMNVKTRPAMSYHEGNANNLDGVIYDVFGFDMPDADGTATVTITMREGFDPVQSFVKDLEEEKRRVTEAFTAQLAAIDEQLKRFTALEMA